MAFLVLGANSVSGYTVKNSLRFNSGSSDYLNRTPASAGSRTTWTWSSWVKRSELATGSAQVLFGAYLTGSDSGWLEFGFDSDNTANWTVQNVGGNSTSVYRDVSAWYHYLMNYDGTASGLKLYINGSQVTISNTSSISGSLGINSASSHRIGRSPNTAVSRQFGGYLADTYFIDGSTLTPSSFGETDFDTGIWKPKAYTGTYGTNGFYLKFANSASLGTDSSGNGNTFTVNNLTSIDQTTDTPTNNFCTLNPNNSNTALASLTQGNTVYTGTSGDNNGIASATFGLNGTGKWYWEAKIINASTGYPRLGVIIDFDSVSQTTREGGYATSQMFPTNVKAVGVTRGSTTLFSLSGDITITAPANGDIIQFAVDRDNGAVYIGNNGTWYNSGVPTSGASRTGAVATFTASGTTNMFVTSDYNGSISNLNFGNPPYSANSYTDGAGYGNFSYQPPANYFSLCTKNLATYG